MQIDQIISISISLIAIIIVIYMNKMTKTKVETKHKTVFTLEQRRKMSESAKIRWSKKENLTKMSEIARSKPRDNHGRFIKK